jgi:hypothetical protein
MEFYKLIDADTLPKNGVVVVTVEEITSDLVDSLQEMGKALKPAISGKNISVLVIKKGEAVETLSVEKMKNLGWIKKPKGDLFVSIEKGQFLDSLVKEVAAGSKGAITELSNLIAEQVVEQTKSEEFLITLK